MEYSRLQPNIEAPLIPGRVVALGPQSLPPHVRKAAATAVATATATASSAPLPAALAGGSTHELRLERVSFRYPSRPDATVRQAPSIITAKTNTAAAPI